MDSVNQQILALAIEAYQAGALEQATKLFQIAALASPLDPNPHSYLGIISIQNDQPDSAVQHFREAIRLNPNDPLHHANLAGALLQLKQSEEALAAAHNALALEPNYPAALLSAGVALLSLGKFEESKVPLQRLLILYPNHIEALNNLGAAMLQLKAFDEAERLLRQAIRLCPSHSKALLNLGSCLFQTHHHQEAAAVCERLLEINPNHLAARFIQCFALLPLIYKDEEEIAAVRTRYEHALHALHDLCDQSTQAELSQALFCIGLCQPFWLAYQGENDRPLQALYGDIIAQFMKARSLARREPRSLRKRTHDERIRVGIVSGFFNLHSNWKTHIRGWTKQINPNAFALFGYYTRGEWDEITEEAQSYLERLTVGPKTLKEYCAAIQEDHLDVLIFPEIGMDSMTMNLAALRLVPVQCTSWGHPDTSGLQTIDFFLSAALMEPSDGDAYYTEKLIRLPNLSIYYEPLSIPHSKRPRLDFGLREDAILYWCCQVPIKYHPRYDEIFVQIARAVPNAQFVFIESLPAVANQFKTRLEKVFARFGLCANDYCVFLPKLSPREFEEASCLMDVFLDSLGWSGCNSSLEALAHDLPIVTFPGRMMRSRHTAAILNMMGMKDEIAVSLEDYLTRAISLGSHPDKRLQMRQRIAAHKHLVYRDETAILALEDFLKSVIN